MVSIMAPPSEEGVDRRPWRTPNFRGAPRGLFSLHEKAPVTERGGRRLSVRAALACPTMRHTNGELHWQGTNQNQRTYPLDANGARYLIDRFNGEWAISFQPSGSAEEGREQVPWLPGKRSMTTAKQAVEAHHQARLSGS